MKPKLLFFFICLFPSLVYCQSITMPTVGLAEDHTTIIKKIEVTKANTVVTFMHFLRGKGAWVQLNKSMYLQDSQGENRYNYVRSEGIPLRPEKFTSDKDYQELEFKVYFEKLKPGTKEINVIERARSFTEQQRDHTSYFNFFNVNLYSSTPTDDRIIRTEVVLTPPPAVDTIDMTSSMMKGDMANLGSMISSMYSNVLNVQIKTYSNPAIINQLAKITKNYYDALIKAGFSMDAALKIITSKQLISMDMGKQ